MKPLEYYATIDAIDLAREPDFQVWIHHPTPETNRFWASLEALYPHQQATIEQACLLVTGLETVWEDIPETVVQDSFQRLWQKQIDQHPEPKRYFLRSAFYRYAAAVALLLGLGWWMYSGTPSAVEYKTDYGQVRTVTLPDGSVVTLNANSILQMPTEWHSEGRREVWLTGEAFFVVNKKPSGKRMPFIVHTGAADIVVMGTQFNVNTRRAQTQVVLQEGKVKVALPAQLDVMMQPGDLVEATNGKAAIHRVKVDAGRYVAWRDNLLILEDEPLSDIIQRFDDQYGLSVSVTNKSLLNEGFTGTVPANQPELLLRLLAETFRLKINKQENQIVLSN